MLSVVKVGLFAPWLINSAGFLRNKSIEGSLSMKKAIMVCMMFFLVLEQPVIPGPKRNRTTKKPNRSARSWEEP